MNRFRLLLNSVLFAKKIHWTLLVFLVLFLNVKLVIKAIAILLLYILQPDFRFGFNWRASRLPLFYPLVIFLSLLNAILYGQFLQLNYLTVLVFGIGVWVACILAIHQLKLIVEKTDS